MKILELSSGCASYLPCFLVVVRINWVSEFPHTNRDYMWWVLWNSQWTKFISHSIPSSVSRWLEMRFYFLLLTPSRILRVEIVLGAIFYNSGLTQQSKFDIDMLRTRKPEKKRITFLIPIGETCKTFVMLSLVTRRNWANVALLSRRKPIFFGRLSKRPVRLRFQRWWEKIFLCPSVIMQPSHF